MFATKILEQSSHLADQARHSADLAVQSTQRAANEALSSAVGVARRASSTTVHYIRDEPVKAVLFAAAAGAVLMALVELLASSRGRR